MLTALWHGHKLDSVGAKADASSLSYPGTRLIADKPSFKDKGRSAFLPKEPLATSLGNEQLGLSGELKKTPLAKSEGLLNTVQQIPFSVS